MIVSIPRKGCLYLRASLTFCKGGSPPAANFSQTLSMPHCSTAERAEQIGSVLEELTRSIETGGAEERLRILRRVTDTFMAGAHTYSDAQIAIFERRLSAARRRARSGSAPDIQVAAPVLVRSRDLSDADLVENARSKSQAHLAIAQRLELSESVTDVLVERGDTRVVRPVARNRRARFSLPGYDKLIVRARHDRKLTLTVGQRRDLPRQCFLKLLENASASVRARLEAAHPQFAAKIQVSIDEAAAQLQQEARANC